MQNETIVVIDFGGQYNQLIARRVREANVYCVVVPYSKSLDEIKAYNPKGIIFTGGPNSVYADNAPLVDKGVFELGIPILGICYGAQLMSYMLGGAVEHAGKREYGVTPLNMGDSILFDDTGDKRDCLMSHTDKIVKVPDGFEIAAYTDSCPIAAFQNTEKGFFGVQFHPEVEHTTFGKQLIHNFLYKACKVSGDWTMADYAKRFMLSLIHI